MVCCLSLFFSWIISFIFCLQAFFFSSLYLTFTLSPWLAGWLGDWPQIMCIDSWGHISWTAPQTCFPTARLGSWWQTYGCAEAKAGPPALLPLLLLLLVHSLPTPTWHPQCPLHTWPTKDQAVVGVVALAQSEASPLFVKDSFIRYRSLTWCQFFMWSCEKSMLFAPPCKVSAEQYVVDNLGQSCRLCILPWGPGTFYHSSLRAESVVLG